MVPKRTGIIIVASMILAFLAFASLAFLPAELHRDWMPDKTGLVIFGVILVIAAYQYAKWSLTWGRIGRR